MLKKKEEYTIKYILDSICLYQHPHTQEVKLNKVKRERERWREGDTENGRHEPL